MPEAPAIPSTTPGGRFPKLRDSEFKDWKLLTNDNGGKIYYRQLSRDRRKLQLSIKAPTRAQAISRGMRALLADNQHVFELQGAGVTMSGGCIPLYSDDGETVVSYTQDYTYTLPDLMQIDELVIKCDLGSVRPYAAELGFAGTQDLPPAAVAVLRAVPYLETIYDVRGVLRILRWLSQGLDRLDVERESPPEVLTVLDYRFLLCLSWPECALELDTGKKMTVEEVTTQFKLPPVVSLAISLHSLWLQQVLVPPAQIDDHA